MAERVRLYRAEGDDGPPRAAGLRPLAEVLEEAARRRRDAEALRLACHLEDDPEPEEAT